MTVPATSDRRRFDVPLTVAALVGWSALVLVAWRSGADQRVEWKLRAAPLAGFFDRHLSVGTVVAVAVGAVGVLALPRWAARVRWRTLVVATVVLAAGWGVVLGLGRGVDDLDRGLSHRHEYPAVIPVVDEVGVAEFVRTFSDEPTLRRYPIHVQGHPVGAVLVFVALDRIGLDGPTWAAAFVVAAGATAAAAVLLTVRQVADEQAARRLAPFLVLAPAAVWTMASADALFAAVGAWSVALLVLATDPARSPRAAAALAVSSGLVAGVGIHLSYGLGPVLLVGVAVVVARRRWSTLAWAALGGAAVTGAAVIGGFWWFDGLAATRIRYHAGIAELRDRAYFTFVGNPAALAIALGPALAVALVRVRDRRLWLLGGAALVAALVANASGLSKAEVERIWLPFTTWIVVLAAGLPALGARTGQPADVGPPPGPPTARTRWWGPWPALATALLALQVLTAVAVEVLVKTPW
jgi:hypothetical protein